MRRCLILLLVLIGSLQLFAQDNHLMRKIAIDSAFTKRDTTLADSLSYNNIKRNALFDTTKVHLNYMQWTRSLAAADSTAKSNWIKKLPGYGLQQNPDSTLNLDSTKISTLYELKKDTTAVRTFSDSKYTKYSDSTSKYYTPTQAQSKVNYSDSTAKFITPTQVNGLDISNWTKYSTYIKYNGNAEFDTLFAQDTAYHPADNSIAPSKLTNGSIGQVPIANSSGIFGYQSINSALVDSAAQPFPRRNLLVWAESGTTISWDSTSSLLSWNGNINIYTPKKRGYTVAAGSLYIPTSGDVVAFSSTPTTFTAINEDLGLPSGNLTGYLVSDSALTQNDLSVKGKVLFGMRRGGRFFLFWSSLINTFNKYISANMMGNNSVPTSAIQSYAIDSTKLGSASVTYNKLDGKPIDAALKRNINILPDNNYQDFELRWNPATSTLSWNRAMFVTTDNTHSQILAGSIVLPNNDDAAVITATNDTNFNAIDEQNGKTTYYVCKVSAGSNFSQKGMIVLGARMRNSFYPFFPSLQRYLVTQNDPFRLMYQRKWFEYEEGHTYVQQEMNAIACIYNVVLRFDTTKTKLYQHKYRIRSLTTTDYSSGISAEIEDDSGTVVARYDNTLGSLDAIGTGGALTRIPLAPYGNSGISGEIYFDNDLAKTLELSSPLGVVIWGGITSHLWIDQSYCTLNALAMDSKTTIIEDTTTIPNNAVIRDYMEAKPDSTLWMVLATGQSNSVGHDGTGTPMDTTQPYNNLKVESATALNGIANLHVDSLYERVKTTSEPFVAYPTAESPYSGLCNTVTKLAKADGLSDYQMIISNNGEDGAPLKSIRKNGMDLIDTPYSPIYGWSYKNSLITMDTAMAYAQRKGFNFRVGAITLIHGETDGGYIPVFMPYGVNKYYKSQLEEFRLDYDKDIKAVTHQLNDVKLLLSQQSLPGTDSLNMILKNQQWQAGVEYPNIFMVSPTYFLPKIDGVHMTNNSARILGEYFGKVYNNVVIKGINWRPLFPETIERSGAVLTVTFHVPVGTLAWVSSTLTNHGFTFYENVPSPAAISSVTILNGNQIRVVLTKAPTGTIKELRYAYTVSGVTGELVDTDTTTGQYGDILKDYCVAFSVKIN